MILSEQQRNDMQEGGQILSAILKELVAMVKPGITTRAVDARAAEMMKERRVKPSFLGYNDFPAVICASLNNEAVHAIPSDREPRAADLPRRHL